MLNVQSLVVRVSVRWWVGSYLGWLTALQSVGYPVNVDKAAERIARYGVRYFP